MITENARSVAHRELPDIPPEYVNDDDINASIVLFYQYVEPMWSPDEHKKALKKVLGLGNKLDIKGRGRVAREGLNCTLSGSPKNIRAFCLGLRPSVGLNPRSGNLGIHNNYVLLLLLLSVLLLLLLLLLL